MTSRTSGSRCWSADALAETSRPATTPRRGRARSRSQARTHESERILQIELLAFGVASIAILKLSGLQAALSHDYAVRDAEQLGVREFDPRPGVAVVEQNLDAGGR